MAATAMDTHPVGTWTRLHLEDFKNVLTNNIERIVRESRGIPCGSEDRSFAASTRGRRDHMEDAAVIGRNLCAVTDGHGGRDAMIAASRYLKKLDAPSVLVGGVRSRIASEFVNETITGDFSPFLSKARKLVAELEQQVEHVGAEDGCTLALVIRSRSPSRVITVATLGDSRVIIVSKTEGVETMQVHADHNTNNENEVSRVQQYAPLSGRRLDGSLMLTRSLGDLQYVDFGLSHSPDISVIRIDSDDVVVIGSDGLFETLNNEQVAVALRVIMEKAPDENAARILVYLASLTGSADNITAVVWDLV